MAAWAKLRKTATGIETHSLVAHSADVAAVMERLLAIPTMADRLARLLDVSELDPVTKARLCLLAAIHDVGKANRGFWNRQPLANGATERDVGLKAGHIGPVVDLMHPQNVRSYGTRPKSHARLVDSLGLDRFFAWTGGMVAFSPLLDAVLMHHGRLPERHNINDNLWLAADGYDPATELSRLGASLEIWYPEGFVHAQAPLPAEKRFLHAFAGLVMLADWIASDESFFHFEAAPDPNRIVFARVKADDVIKMLHLDPVESRQPLQHMTNLAGPIIGANRTPRPAQEVMGKAVAKPGSIVVIEAETGSGKTEAALIHFLHLFKAGQVDGLYFALPTRAAAVQIHRRIFMAFKSLLGDHAPPVVLAVPGYLRVDDQEGAKLAPFDVHWPDNAGDNLKDRAWAAEHPKRYLAAAVAVGTVDQVMLGALNVRHAQLRSGPMLRQLLVVDEVHASDPYMERILRQLLEQHRIAGGHALLMSATLGTASRLRLMGKSARETRNLPSVAELAAAPYPAIHTGVDTRITTLPITSMPARKVAIELLDADDANRTLAERAVDAALSGARVLVIRNKVDDAVETARLAAALAQDHGRPDIAFRCQGIATVHHGRFAPSDRRLLDVALEQALGRDSRNPVVAVTTQTAEQSLDIDADILLTDICPADVLLQRLGRLHRHERKRPDGFEYACALVLAPGEGRLGALLAADGSIKGRLLGLGKVYPDLVGIVATRRILQKLGAIEIPRHNRLLVEHATHAPFLEILAKELGTTWAEHHKHISGLTTAQSQVARLNLLAFDEPIMPLRDLDARIVTRLGADNRAARMATPITGPFGAPVRDLTIPGWMVRGISLDTEPDAVTTIPGGFCFAMGSKVFSYNEWGISQGTDR